MAPSCCRSVGLSFADAPSLLFFSSITHHFRNTALYTIYTYICVPFPCHGANIQPSLRSSLAQWLKRNKMKSMVHTIAYSELNSLELCPFFFSNYPVHPSVRWGRTIVSQSCAGRALLPFLFHPSVRYHQKPRMERNKTRFLSAAPPNCLSAKTSSAFFLICFPPFHHTKSKSSRFSDWHGKMEGKDPSLFCPFKNELSFDVQLLIHQIAHLWLQQLPFVGKDMNDGLLRRYIVEEGDGEGEKESCCRCRQKLMFYPATAGTGLLFRHLPATRPMNV